MQMLWSSILRASRFDSPSGSQPKLCLLNHLTLGQILYPDISAFAHTMSQPSEEVELEIVGSEFKSGKHLVFQYKVKNPDHSSEDCRDVHLRQLNSRKETKNCVEIKEDNLIWLKFDFDVWYSEDGDSYKILTNEGENAKKIQDCFSGLAFGYGDHGQGCHFQLPKKYSYNEWVKNVKPKARAKDSRQKDRPRSDSTPAKHRSKSSRRAFLSKLPSSSKKKTEKSKRAASTRKRSKSHRDSEKQSP